MKRLDKLYTILSQKKLFPYILFDLKNICYLTGFKGSNGYLIIDKEDSWFITDSRYEEYARNIVEPNAIKFVLQSGSFIDEVNNLVVSEKWKDLFLEDHAIMLANYIALDNEVSAKLHAAGNITQQLRVVKSTKELQLISKAAEITDSCLEHLCTMIKPGMSEWDIAVEIEYYYRTHGASGSSFDSIVASGKNSSMPHYETSMNKILETGDSLLIDMGCTYEGYNSDLTRTLFIGNINPVNEKIYMIVNRARQAAVDAVRPGITTGELDSIARTLISSEGYGEYFGHSLGHGVGMDVHEHPRVKADDGFTLVENTVITIEPGIYLPGSGGVRIEDLVQVTENGSLLLSKSPREIRIL